MNNNSLNQLRTIGQEFGGEKGLQAINNWIDVFVESLGINHTITYDAIKQMNKDRLVDYSDYLKKSCLKKLGQALEPFCEIYTYPDDLTEQEMLSGMNGRYRNNFGGQITSYKISLIKS